MPHPVDRPLEDRHLGAEPERHDRRVVADDPAADDHNPPRSDSGHAAEQKPAAAERLLEEVRASLGRKPARDLGHRREQRQRSAGRLDGLVRDGGHAGVDERARQRLVGRDMQVREEREPVAQAPVLGCDRLLDLEQELARAPHLVHGADRRTDSLVGSVGERASRSRPGLDRHLVTAVDQLEGARGSQRDAVFVGLDLLRDSDPHGAGTIPAGPPPP